MRPLAFLIARGLFSLIFIVAGVSKLIYWEESVDRLALALSEWSFHLNGHFISASLYKGWVSSSSILLAIGIAFELMGAFLILTGLAIRLGAFFLLLFMVPVNIIMHPFWWTIEGEMRAEFQIFLKNLSLIGALVYFLISPQRRLEAQ